MQQVFQLFQRRSNASNPVKQVPAHDLNQRIVNFSFVDDVPTEPSANVVPFEAPRTVVGRTEACVSAGQLSAVGRGQGQNVVYLQEELCEKKVRRQRTHVLFQGGDVQRSAPRKIQATALLDASELIKHRSNTGAYQKQQVRPATNKLLNQKVAQQLNERSSREELLSKVKDACQKVASDALVSAPRFHGYAAPSRHRIQIKIG